MRRCFKKSLLFVFIFCLVLGIAQTTLASAEMFRTTESVNFRTGPSTADSIIKTLGTGSDVEMLDHDPADWSKVRVSDTIGYIRSDFLMFPVGNAPAAFKTTIGVNFRKGPSTYSNVIRVLSTGTAVEVLEHDPAGWSSVRINGTVGYISSAYLKWPSQSSQQSAAASSAATSAESGSSDETGSVYSTIDYVNFRSGPSTESGVIKVVKSGTVVEMVEYDPNGWSLVIIDGVHGYIRSDFLVAGTGGGKIGNVELLSWSEAKDLVPKGVLIPVVDVRTGRTFNLKCFSKGGHADVEPPTKADTDTIYDTRNGVWSWDARPVWVTIGNRTIAAALNGNPHAGSTISGNGMNGHLCLHFNNTVTNSKSYQKDLNNAVIEAWNAGKNR